MTHSEKLNKILNVLLYTHRMQLAKHQLDKRLTFDFICKTVVEVTDNWEIDFLKQILLTDGYMKMGEFDDGELPEITQKGIKFVQYGAYEIEKKNFEIDQKIKKETLKKFLYDKYAFVISILSLIIAVISILKK